MKSDIQFRRTDRDIINAFMNLLQKKPFEKITVQDIMGEAMISRSTFYLHFKDKYEITEKLQSYYTNELKRTINDLRKKTPTDIKEINKIIRAYFIENRASLKSLIKIKTEHTDIINALNELVKEEYLSSSDSPNSEMEANMYSSIIVGFMINYINNDNISSDYSELFIHVFMNTILKILSLENDTEVASMLYKKIIENNLKKNF